MLLKASLINNSMHNYQNYLGELLRKRIEITVTQPDTIK